ncbi:hypothetical protein ACEQ8H_006135 [Pleosporales sp. CAS-2024a]
MKLFGPISVLLWACAITAQSADATVPPALPSLSPCVMNCITTTPTEANCSPTDRACSCADTKGNAAVARCIAMACTVKDSLTARNFTAIACNEPVRNQYNELKVVNIAMITISAVFITVRIGHKLMWSNHAQLGLDDLFIVLTFLTLLPNAVCVDLKLLPNGLGRDIWTLQFYEVTEYLKYFYVGEITYLATLPILKMSFLFFYKRIFPARTVQRVIIGTIVFNTLWGFVIVMVAIFSCIPISYFWNVWDHEHKGYCINMTAMNWANAFMSIILDVWMLAIPLSQLINLKLSALKKWGVILMFCLGTLATLISIIRLKFLAVVSTTLNPTWDHRNITKWSNIEIAVGVVCSCLPSVRMLLVRSFPSVFGSTHQSTQQNQYATPHARSSRYAQFPSTKSSFVRDDESNSKGIHCTTTFTMQHEMKDDDEVELVDMGHPMAEK